MPEADLYDPVKRFLEARGYEVKGEVGPCDVLAVRGDEGPVVVELKERLTLTLVLQAVDRLTVSDAVYVCVRPSRGSGSRRGRTRRIVGLLRRLGIGLLTVSERGDVTCVLDPAPYRPRQSTRRRSRLLKEFQARAGDPELGGSESRARMTAYRQDAIRCANELARAGTLKVAVVQESSGVVRAGRIMRDNHYGWFERVRTGYYSLTSKGEKELPRWRRRLEEGHSRRKRSRPSA